MLRRTRRRVNEVESGVESVDASKSTASVESAKKKQSSTVVKPLKRRSKVVGKLALLLEMPTEVFTEIACYMSPEDLLNLARTSPDFRELLMSKSSKRVWEAARTVQGIPVCPSDLSEPQYADLLFGKGCSFCSETRTRKTHIVLRVRACKLCIEEKLVCVDEVLQAKNYSMPDCIMTYSIIPLIELRSTKYSGLILEKAVASHLNEVLEKIEALSSNTEKLQAYILDRKRITRAILESKRPIEEWLHKTSHEKERSNEELVKERRANIEERLRALGYEDEDFNTNYDVKGWKWKHLLNQTRPVSERVWQNIRPQLEETIQIRRAHAGPRFLAIRREKRLSEVKEQYSKSRHRLDSMPMGKLFLLLDLLDLPVVKEVMEENDYRFLVTDERWLRVSKSFPDIVAAHLKIIETDCAKKIKHAKDAAFEVSNGLGHPLLVDGDDSDCNRESEKDEDLIPACLLSATSLFKRGFYGSTSLESYGEILRKRSIIPIQVSWLSSHTAWCNEKFESSGDIDTTATSLLECLELPKETTMSYVLACGRGFRCLRCFRSSGKGTFTWPQLVLHFIKQNETFEDLCRKNKERKLDVPMRKHHNLDFVGKIVTRSIRTTVEMEPTGENADRYSVLSTSWGKMINNEKVLEAVEDPCDGESEDEPIPDPGWRTTYCTLCDKLNYMHSESTQSGMRWHMKTNHGTDLDGNLLHEENAS